LPLDRIRARPYFLAGEPTPIAIQSSRSFPTAGGRPVNFALNKGETLFYVSGFNAVQVMDYQTGVQVDGISTGLISPSGVALYPPPPY